MSSECSHSISSERTLTNNHIIIIVYYYLGQILRVLLSIISMFNSTVIGTARYFIEMLFISNSVFTRFFHKKRDQFFSMEFRSNVLKQRSEKKGVCY